MGHIKSLFSKKALAIETVETQEKLYMQARRQNPNKEPHELLMGVYLGRRQVIGDDITRDGVQMAAETETEMFACLQDPYCAKALGLYMLYKERDTNKGLIKHYPAHQEAYARLVSQLFYLKENEPEVYELIYSKYNPKMGFENYGITSEIDEQAKFRRDLGEARVIIKLTNKAGTAILQRRLSIGYGTAAKILDELELQGVIGAVDGNKPREIYL